MAWQIPCTKEFCCRKHCTNFFYFLTVVIWSNMKQCEARVKTIYIFRVESPHHFVVCFFCCNSCWKAFLYGSPCAWAESFIPLEPFRSHHIASRNNGPLPPSVDATFPLSILWVFFDKFNVSHTYSSVERGIGYFGKNVLTSAERTRLLLSKSFCEGHSSIYYQGRDGGSWISKSNTPTLRLQLLLVLKS